MSKSLKTVHLDFMPSAPKGEKLQVDKEQRILYGTQVCKIGEAQGHGFALDQTSLDQLVTLASKNGVRCRFGHPSLCSPGLGTFLGRHHNFYQDGDYLRADLHISSAAKEENAAHVMKMAELEPDMIGQSICISCELEELEDSPIKDSEGNVLPVARIKQFTACDVVDQGAATDAMFAKPIDGVNLNPREMVKAKQILNTPGVIERLFSFLSGADIEAPETKAGVEVSTPKEIPVMELTLKDFKANYPEVAEAYAAELSAPHADAVAASLEKGVAQERSRVGKFLSKCKPYHFAATAEHPNGFVSHAVNEGLAYEDCLEGLMALNEKQAELTALHVGDGELAGITPAEPFDKSLSGEAAATAAMEAARKRREK